MGTDDNGSSKEFEIDDDQFTDTDLFDPELLAKEMETLRNPRKRVSDSARTRVEEMLEHKRLEREIREFEDDEFEQTWVDEPRAE